MPLGPRYLRVKTVRAVRPDPSVSVSGYITLNRLARSAQLLGSTILWPRDSQRHRWILSLSPHCKNAGKSFSDASWVDVVGDFQ